jgi:hypothetical protein
LRSCLSTPTTAMAATAAAVPQDTGQPGLLTGTYAVGTVQDTGTKQSVVKYSTLCCLIITIIFVSFRFPLDVNNLFHVKTKKRTFLKTT